MSASHFINRLAQHAAHKLKQLQVGVVQGGRGRWVEAGLWGGPEQVQRRVKNQLYRLLQEFLKYIKQLKR